MFLLRPGGTNSYHHTQHIKSVGTHMYQLHYHHPYYASFTVSFKKKQMKQAYYFHHKQPN